MLQRRESKIHGQGIFTSEKINAGDCFYFVPVEKVASQSAPRLARLGDNLFVDDQLVLNWVNHSCDPSAYLVTGSVRPLLLARRDISPGEEVTVDYNLTELARVKNDCRCGATNCCGYFFVS